jgi:hypothetical protein
MFYVLFLPSLLPLPREYATPCWSARVKTGGELGGGGELVRSAIDRVAHNLNRQ